MRTITEYKVAANLCQTFTGHLVARANKTLNGIYRPYCLLNDDLTPLFCWSAQLCVQLYLAGYLLRNGGVLVASNPDAGSENPKSCDHPCSPSDFYKGGKCDKMGCYPG